MKNFNSFQLDTENGCIWRAGTLVGLSPKAFAIARYLIERADRVVTKDELLEAVWPDVYVQEANLKVYIRELRRALGDDATHPWLIETQRGIGYRFIAPVTNSSLSPQGPVNYQKVKRVPGRDLEAHKLHEDAFAPTLAASEHTR
jgi:DNA-binding winged helix-turn-helix (wHTH) protein